MNQDNNNKYENRSLDFSSSTRTSKRPSGNKGISGPTKK